MGALRDFMDQQALWFIGPDTEIVLQYYTQFEPEEVRTPLLNFLEAGAAEIVFSLLSYQLAIAGPRVVSLQPIGVAQPAVGLLVTRWLGCNPQTGTHKEWVTQVFNARRYGWSDILMASGDVRRATHLEKEVPREFEDFLNFARRLKESELQYPLSRQQWQPVLYFPNRIESPLAIQAFLWWCRVVAIEVGNRPFPKLEDTLNDFRKALG